jgi:hypothetical protein
MRVSALDLDAASKTLDESRIPAPLSFFEVFGVKNCSLGCEDRKQLLGEPQISGYGPRRKHGNRSMANPQLSQSIPKWEGPFTLQDLSNSAKNGCGSCHVFKVLLNSILPAIHRIPGCDWIFRWCGSRFELEISGRQAKTKELIQLFHPCGKLSQRPL